MVNLLVNKCLKILPQGQISGNVTIERTSRISFDLKRNLALIIYSFEIKICQKYNTVLTDTEM